jgi:hypothetical protein
VPQLPPDCRGRHPDVRLLVPEESSRGNLALKIEQIRDLQQG